MSRLSGCAMVLAFVALASCGGDGGSGGTGPALTALTGTYSGTATITNQANPSQPFTVNFTVVGNGSGNTLSGIWVVGGSAGTLSGTVSGSAATFSLLETSPCSGSFTGTATISDDGNHAEGTFSGSDCDGVQTATFVLDRTGGGASLTGDFVGTADVSGAGQFDVQITIIQTGTSLTGTWASSAGGSGTAAGVVNGTTVQFTLTQTDPCDGLYTGSAQVQSGGNRISGSYSGNDCGFALSATFSVNRR